MEASREWLEQFPAEHRGAIGNWFYDAARRATRRAEELSPRPLCSEVHRYLTKQLQSYGHPGSHGVNKLAVLRAMNRDPTGAQRFMAWVIEQESRPPEERERDKEAAEAEGKRRYMEGLPPTQKQLDTLLRLGVDELPENRWRASELIEEHKTW